MATEPYSQGVADVMPTPEAPAPRTDPTMFGGGVAQGLGQLGADTSKASQVFGEMQTDDMVNQAMGGISKQLDTFRSLSGADAWKAQQPTNDAIDQLVQQTRGELKLPVQQRQFDQAIRAYRNRYVDGVIDSHADQQAKVYGDGVYQQQAQLGLDHVSKNADDPDQVAAAREDVRQAYVRRAQLTYGDSAGPDVISGAVSQADQLVAKSQAMSIGAKDPSRAADFVEQNKAVLGADYAPLSNSFRARAIQEQAPVEASRIIGNSAGGRVIQQPGPPVTSMAMGTAIRGQESGNNPNVGVSVNNAHGIGQITPATFAQFAKPGENIDNPADNAAVSQRMIDNYYTQYNGDTSRVAGAYFSGPGNVAPPDSPTPWRPDKQDGNGQSVSGYVNGINAKLGRADMKMTQAQAESQADQEYANNPQMAAAVKTQIRQQFATYNMAEQSQMLAKQAESEQAHSDFVTRIMKGDTGTIINDIASNNSLTGPQKENLYDFANKAMTSKLGGDDAQYGMGFHDALKQINLPPNDPNRINSVGQLVQMATQGGLKVAGVEKLTSVMKSLSQPGNASYSKIQERVLNQAKADLSFQDDFRKDANGERAFAYGFVPAFYKAWDSAVAAGKNPEEFVNADNIKKMEQPFQRNPAQLAQDTLHAQLAIPVEANQDVPDLSKMNNLQDMITAYNANKGRYDYNQVISMARSKGFIQVAPTQNQVPLQ